MYTLTKYFNDTRLLASSFVIKHHHIALAVNRGLLNLYGIMSSNDYTTWKYYLNLSGVKHSTNSNVMTPVVELLSTIPTNVSSALTGAAQPLTTTLLDANPRTRELLDSRTELYHNLITSFPNDVDYINGCINPVDINTAINSPDGTILSWSKQYIEPQEYSLIKELNKEIKLFFSRWYIRDYSIPDELYISSVMGVLWSTLPNTIVLNRLRDSYTAEAHSFHLEHFFRSRLNIWKEVSTLHPKTIRWLYSNLVTLINNAGTNDTFNTIVNKIFTPENVGVGRFDLSRNGVIETTNPSLTDPTYTRLPPTLVPSSLNGSYDIRTASKSLNEIITKELIHTSINGKVTNLNAVTASEMELNNLSTNNVSKSQFTKVIDFGNIELFKFYNNGLIETVLDNWLYMANSGVYVTQQTFNDPNTGNSHKMTPLTAIMLFYRLLYYKLDKSDPVISNIKYRNIINSNINANDLIGVGWLHANGLSSIANDIASNIPKPPVNVRTPNIFNTEMSKIVALFERIWVLDSNVNNSFLSANIKTMVNTIFIEGVVNIPNASGLTLSAYLKSVGVDIPLTPTYDIAATHTTLFTLFTGFNLDETILVRELYSNYELLMEKLSSYTIQTIPPTINNGNLNCSYTTTSVINGSTGYIQVRKGNIVRILEVNNSTITGKGNDFIEYCIPSNLSTVNMLDVDRKNHIHLTSSLSYGGMGYNQNTKPNSLVEIKRSSYIPYYPSNTLETNNMYPPTPVAINIGTGSKSTSTRSGVGGVSIGNVNKYINTTKPNTYSELIYGSYNIFTPISKGVSNNTGPANPVTTLGTPPNVTGGTTTGTGLLGGVSSPASVTSPKTYVGLPNSNYNIYTPINTGYSNTTGNATPVTKTTPPAPNVTAAITDPTIQGTGVNASITTTPTVNIQIPGNKPVK